MKDRSIYEDSIEVLSVASTINHELSFSKFAYDYFNSPLRKFLEQGSFELGCLPAGVLPSMITESSSYPELPTFDLNRCLDIMLVYDIVWDKCNVAASDAIQSSDLLTVDNLLPVSPSLGEMMAVVNYVERSVSNNADVQS